MRRLSLLLILVLLSAGCSKAQPDHEGRVYPAVPGPNAATTPTTTSASTTTSQQAGAVRFCSDTDAFCVTFPKRGTLERVDVYDTYSLRRSVGKVTSTGYHNGSDQFMVVLAQRPGDPHAMLRDIRDWSFEPSDMTWHGDPALHNTMRPEDPNYHVVNEVLKVSHGGKVYMLFSLAHQPGDVDTKLFYDSLRFTS